MTADELRLVEELIDLHVAMATNGLLMRAMCGTADPFTRLAEIRAELLNEGKQ